jgi:hypothetical protein
VVTLYTRQPYLTGPCPTCPVPPCNSTTPDESDSDSEGGAGARPAYGAAGPAGEGEPAPAVPSAQPAAEDARKTMKRKHARGAGEGEGAADASEGAGAGEEPARAAPAQQATVLVVAPQRTTPASDLVAAAGPRRALVQSARSWKEDKKDFKCGKFSKTEHESLRRAIEAHLRAHPGNFDTVEDFGTNAKKGEWMDICSALSERTLLSCYEYSRRHFNEGNYKGAWTDEEVTRLRRLHGQYGNKWTVIAEELGRERTNVRDK